MNRAVFEALDHDQLVELTCRLHRFAIEQAGRLAMNSSNSSRPPSSDPPFGIGGAGGRSACASQANNPTAAPPVAAAPSRKPPHQTGRSVARKLFDVSDGSDDGLLDRFGLIAYPDLPADWQLVDRWSDTPKRQAFNHACDHLVETTWGNVLQCDDDVEAGKAKPFA